ncbi:MAG: hypothetical protein R8G66_25410 [Cytophagales bacterium]|nr:hypothetical protein [Cytophagales bacterium]
MKISRLFVERTHLRDRLIFLLYACLITLLFAVGTFGPILPNFGEVTLLILTLAQFYLSAFLVFPISKAPLRYLAYAGFFIFNYVLYRQIATSLLWERPVVDLTLEWMLGLTFLLTLVGRNIRMYISLIENLKRLNDLRQHNFLFSKPEKVTINFGNEGKLTLHPNEIVYIRTRSAGDHTKIFGLKVKKGEKGQEKLVEYETNAYQNFNEIFKELVHFPQFKRISQSTVVNFQYPSEEKNGTLIIESRRFSISPKYAPKK